MALTPILLFLAGIGLGLLFSALIMLVVILAFLAVACGLLAFGADGIGLWFIITGVVCLEGGFLLGSFIHSLWSDRKGL